jgi:hypothetical protein
LLFKSNHDTGRDQPRYSDVKKTGRQEEVLPLHGMRQVFIAMLLSDVDANEWYVDG